jgi:hypothetical protein
MVPYTLPSIFLSLYLVSDFDFPHIELSLALDRRETLDLAYNLLHDLEEVPTSQLVAYAKPLLSATLPKVCCTAPRAQLLVFVSNFLFLIVP